MKYLTKYIVSIIVLIYCCGCVSVKSPDTIITPSDTMINPSEKKGVYHTVQKGETLWRIAKSYGVDLDTIVSENKILDTPNIEVGQSIFIPGAERVQVLNVSMPEQPDNNPNNFIWPAKGEIVRSYKKNNNRGIEISVPLGTRIKASRSGKVVFADYLPGSEQTVIVDHNDGYLTVYSKASTILVGINSNVAKGQDIAIAENNDGRGVFSFQVRKGELEKNPMYFLP